MTFEFNKGDIPGPPQTINGQVQILNSNENLNYSSYVYETYTEYDDDDIL